MMASDDRTRAFRKPTISETMAGATTTNTVHFASMPWALATKMKQSKNEPLTASKTTTSQGLTAYESGRGPSYAQKSTEIGKLPRTYVVLARKNDTKDSQEDKDLQNLIIVDSKIISDKIELDLQKRGVKLENLVGSKSFQTFSHKNQEKLLQRLMPHSSRKDVSSYMTARARERGIKGISPVRGADKGQEGASGLNIRGSSPLREKRFVAPAPTGTTQAHERALSTVAENETTRGQHACTRTEAIANRITNNSRTDTLKTETMKSETFRVTPNGMTSPIRDQTRYSRIRREAFQSPTRTDFQQFQKRNLGRAETATSRVDHVLEQMIHLQPDQKANQNIGGELRLPSAMPTTRSTDVLRPDIQVIPRPIGPPGVHGEEGGPRVDVSDWLHRNRTPSRTAMPPPPARPSSRGPAYDSPLLRRPKNPTNRMASATRTMTETRRVADDATPLVENLGNPTYAVLPNNYGPTDAYRKCLNWVNSLPDSFSNTTVDIDNAAESQSSTDS